MHARRTHPCIYVCVCLLDRFENSKLEFGIEKAEVLRQITRNIRSEWCDTYCDPTTKNLQISSKEFRRLGPVVFSFHVQLFLVNSLFFSLPNFFLVDGQTP